MFGIGKFKSEFRELGRSKPDCFSQPTATLPRSPRLQHPHPTLPSRPASHPTNPTP